VSVETSNTPVEWARVPVTDGVLRDWLKTLSLVAIAVVVCLAYAHGSL
jgi:negative regulator of sigma E activity